MDAPLMAPPKLRKLTAEEKAGNKLFHKEVAKAGGAKGFVENIKRRDEKAKADAAAVADRMMDENLKPFMHQINPRFSFSDIPQEKWDLIFGKKEEVNHAQV